MHHIIYKTTNLINGNIYVGVHSTNNIDDGYLGSGKFLKMAVSKYGEQNFSREILIKCSSREEAFELENLIVDKEFVSRRDTYNSDLGGSGGKIWTPDLIQKMSDSQKRRFENGAIGSMTGKTHKQETKDKISNKLIGKFDGDKNPMFGVNYRDLMSTEAKELQGERISAANSGKVRTNEHKKNYSEAAKRRRWLVHKSGTISSTTDLNDQRFNDPDWQPGKKWK